MAAMPKGTTKTANGAEWAPRVGSAAAANSTLASMRTSRKAFVDLGYKAKGINTSGRTESTNYEHSNGSKLTINQDSGPMGRVSMKLEFPA